MVDGVWAAWEFAKRHKKKLILGVLVGGAGIFATYTAHSFKKRLKEMESLLPVSEELGEDQLSVLRMQVHLQTCLNDGERSVRTHLDQLHLRLTELTPVDGITARLKRKPSKAEKRQLWEQLKHTSIVRLISALYGVSLLHVMIHIQLTLLSRYLFRRSSSRVSPDGSNEELPELGEDTKMHVLRLLAFFNETGIARLVSFVQAAVTSAVDHSLSGEFTPESFKHTLEAVCALLDGDGPLRLGIGQCLFPEQWSVPSGLELVQAEILAQIRTEMIDIVSGPAMAQVVSSLVRTVLAFSVEIALPSSLPHPESPLSSSVLSVGSETATRADSASPNLKPKVVSRLPQVVKVTLLKDGELVFRLGENPIAKELFSLIFTADSSAIDTT